MESRRINEEEEVKLNREIKRNGAQKHPKFIQTEKILKIFRK